MASTTSTKALVAILNHRLGWHEYHIVPLLQLNGRLRIHSGAQRKVGIRHVDLCQHCARVGIERSCKTDDLPVKRFTGCAYLYLHIAALMNVRAHPISGTGMRRRRRSLWATRTTGIDCVFEDVPD